MTSKTLRKYVVDQDEFEHSDLERRFGYTFINKELLKTAMRHRSWTLEGKHRFPVYSNELLEFLGDSVKQCVVADIIFHRFENLQEGDLTTLRKRVVNGTTMASIARALGVGAHLQLGNGEMASRSFEKPSILSDAFEAMIGAVYVDAGWDKCKEVVELHLGKSINDAVLGDSGNIDSKNRLQNLVAKPGFPCEPDRFEVTYQHLESGPPHQREFKCFCMIGTEVMGVAIASSKKAAEKEAAANAYPHVEQMLSRIKATEKMDPFEKGFFKLTGILPIRQVDSSHSKVKSSDETISRKFVPGINAIRTETKHHVDISPLVVRKGSLCVPHIKKNEDLTGLQGRLRYVFSDVELLRTALRHRSWVQEVDNSGDSYERLEFLGDAILGVGISKKLYDRAEVERGAQVLRPGAPVKSFVYSDVRKRVVNEFVLSNIARSLGVGDHLLLSNGETAANGHEKASILADALEAIIGAVYLDGGWYYCQELISEHLGDELYDAFDKDCDHTDIKNRLQNLVAKPGFPCEPDRFEVTYQHLESGPPHQREFKCFCMIGTEVMGVAIASSKKAAEKEAAANAYPHVEQMLSRIKRHCGARDPR